MYRVLGRGAPHAPACPRARCLLKLFSARSPFYLAHPATSRAIPIMDDMYCDPARVCQTFRKDAIRLGREASESRCKLIFKTTRAFKLKTP